jgi:probable F420-dependent oxidoreductase
MRFGVSAAGFQNVEQLVERARWAERVGFSTFSVSDHLNGHSPFVTLQAIAGVTSRIRLGTLVINNDLRHPAILAQDAATVDRLSRGRLELGLGAGWALAEYRRAGISYDPPRIRIDRLRETASALRALFAGAPVTTAGQHVNLQDHFVVPSPSQGQGLPLLIGGNGNRLLTIAAQQADIVSFTAFSPDHEGYNVRTHFSRSGLADRVALVRKRSADRAEPLELNVLLQSLVITDDREFMARTIAQRHGQSLVEVLTCPFLAFGTVEEICGQVTRLRDDFGIGYVTVFDQHADDTATILAAVDAPTGPAGSGLSV